MVNSFLVSLDITVIIINILQEIIKILHEKMLGNKWGNKFVLIPK